MGEATSIEPATLGHIDALIAGDAEFTRRFGLDVAEGYLDFPEILPATRRALLDGMPAEWFSHLIIGPDAGRLIGFGGFKGPPDRGRVEIGYSIAPAHRRRGHATAAARAMIERARRAGVTTVLAHTLPEENPSTRVLRACGLHRVADVADPAHGTIWRWELRLDDGAEPETATPRG